MASNAWTSPAWLRATRSIPSVAAPTVESLDGKGRTGRCLGAVTYAFTEANGPDVQDFFLFWRGPAAARPPFHRILSSSQTRAPDIGTPSAMSSDRFRNSLPP